VGIPDGEDSGRLFLRVDEALYLAKHKGRNRVEVMG
jgi:PleD family two-component response regulator